MPDSSRRMHQPGKRTDAIIHLLKRLIWVRLRDIYNNGAIQFGVECLWWMEIRRVQGSEVFSDRSVSSWRTTDFTTFHVVVA
mmetsp:Transcript_18080/g.34300  ORF Transcript_18080/g.34300 Transcript_18080/m.34300 type:complete len:82 (+) Transcript_18080:193-438(+)